MRLGASGGGSGTSLVPFEGHPPGGGEVSGQSCRTTFQRSPCGLVCNVAHLGTLARARVPLCTGTLCPTPCPALRAAAPPCAAPPRPGNLPADWGRPSSFSMLRTLDLSANPKLGGLLPVSVRAWAWAWAWATSTLRALVPVWPAARWGSSIYMYDVGIHCCRKVVYDANGLLHCTECKWREERGGALLVASTTLWPEAGWTAVHPPSTPPTPWQRVPTDRSILCHSMQRALPLACVCM